MPKSVAHPILYNEVKTISISNLKKWGYLKLGERNAGGISWSCDGSLTGSIALIVDTRHIPYIALSYKLDSEVVNYTVQLVSMPSNLGKGVVWFFLCPNTGKRCRKLYQAGEKFLHREAFNGCMYESQTRSHKLSVFAKMLQGVTAGDKAMEQLYKKHFKTYYAGKPTKRYLKLKKQIEESENISIDQIS